MESRHNVSLVLPDKSEILLNNVPFSCSAEQMFSRISSLDRIKKLNAELELIQDGKLLELDDCITQDIVVVQKVKYSTSKLVFNTYLAVIIILAIIPVATYIRLNRSTGYVIISFVICLFIFSILTILVQPPRDSSDNIKNHIVLELIVLFFKSMSPRFRLVNLIINE